MSFAMHQLLRHSDVGPDFLRTGSLQSSVRFVLGSSMPADVQVPAHEGRRGAGEALKRWGETDQKDDCLY